MDVPREAVGDRREDVRVRIDDRHAASTNRRAASAYSSAACRIPATGALSFGACARGRKPGPNAGDRRDTRRELEERRVGRAGEDADGSLVAEHDPARVAERRDELVRRVDLGRRHPDLEVELGVELGIVGRGVAQEALEVLDERLARHAGQRADVAGELGLARVDAVEDAGARHDADVHGRRPPRPPPGAGAAGRAARGPSGRSAAPSARSRSRTAAGRRCSSASACRARAL